MFTTTKQGSEKHIVINKTIPTKPSKAARILYRFKYVFLIMFAILLVAQLRAKELPDELEKLSKLNRSEIGDYVHYSSNRSDTSTQFSNVDLGNSESSVRVATNNVLNGANGTLDVSIKDTQDGAHRKNDLDKSILDPSPVDLLVAQTANNVQVQHAPGSDPAKLASQAITFDQDPNQLAHLSAGLAELTAAGTAAGLMIHELSTQNQRQETNPTDGEHAQDQYTPFSSESVKEIGLIPNADADFLNMNSLATGQKLGHAQRLMRNQDLNDDDDALERANNRDEVPDSRNNEYTHDDTDSIKIGRTVDSQIETMANGEKIPDSMNSLLGANEKNDDADENHIMENQLREVVETKSINDPPNSMSSMQSKGMRNSTTVHGKDTGSYDDDNEAKIAEDSISRLNHFLPLYSTNLPDVTGAQIQTKPEALQRVDGHQIRESLIGSPMVDSMSDLSTAAGHYYGKKKKVKKVVYKKKKKKKYVKKKKIKVVKVKKKKHKKMKKKKHHDHGKYYMYAKVPKKKAWEFGFKKGNKKHWIERHEKGHKNKFKTKVKWYDKKNKGKGVHIWDYNHHDKKKKHH